jgi:hypothetical protein
MHPLGARMLVSLMLEVASTYVQLPDRPVAVRGASAFSNEAGPSGLWRQATSLL